MEEGVELCLCNNCDTTLIDENPQVGAKKHKLKGGEQSMEHLKYQKENLSGLVQSVVQTDF